MRRFMVAASLVAVCASGAAAQVPWDSPMMAKPRATPGVGVFVADVGGGGMGAIVTYQKASRWGLRFGLAEGPGSEVSVFGGADLIGSLARASANMPLDIGWVFGAGLGIQDAVLVSVPFGISLAHTFRSGNTTFIPYVTPRPILDAAFGREARGNGNGRGRGGPDNVNLALAVDLGLDLRLQAGWTVRFGATMGDRDALALGLVF
jgi:hypothetical protein